jgi:hypothetical protein
MTGHKKNPNKRNKKNFEVFYTKKKTPLFQKKLERPFGVKSVLPILKDDKIE